jgi:hypothetical protein
MRGCSYCGTKIRIQTYGFPKPISRKDINHVRMRTTKLPLRFQRPQLPQPSNRNGAYGIRSLHHVPHLRVPSSHRIPQTHLHLLRLPTRIAYPGGGPTPPPLKGKFCIPSCRTRTHNPLHLSRDRVPAQRTTRCRVGDGRQSTKIGRKLYRYR